MKPLYDKFEVAEFLAKFHKTNYGSDISKIKMQKGLYFMFAYFSQFVYRSTNSELENEFPIISNYLFDPKFEAWSYGPVDREIYNNHYQIIEKSNQCNLSQFMNKSNSEYVEDYLDTLARQIFNSSDFGLVELSHQDASWKNHYRSDRTFPDEMIPGEEIIYEYQY